MNIAMLTRLLIVVQFATILLMFWYIRNQFVSLKPRTEQECGCNHDDNDDNDDDGEWLDEDEETDSDDEDDDDDEVVEEKQPVKEPVSVDEFQKP